MNKLLTVEEVAKAFDRSTDTIYRWVRERPDFPKPISVGAKRYFRISDLDGHYSDGESEINTISEKLAVLSWMIKQHSPSVPKDWISAAADDVVQHISRSLPEGELRDVAFSILGEVGK